MVIMTRIVKHEMRHVSDFQGTQLKPSYSLEPWPTPPVTGFLTTWSQTSCAHYAVQLYLEIFATFHGMLKKKSYNENIEYNDLQ